MEERCAAGEPIVIGNIAGGGVAGSSPAAATDDGRAAGIILPTLAATTQLSGDQAPIIPINASAALWRDYESRPASLKAEAARRLKKLQDAEALWIAGMAKAAACAAMAGEDGASTVLRWWSAAGKHDRKDWLPALVPNYRGPGACAEAKYSPKIWDWWKADYLRMEHPTAAACYERVGRLAAARGLEMPSLASLKRRTERDFNPQVLKLARYGPDALKRSYPHQQRDRSVFHALEAVNADGHIWNVSVVWPDGEVRRPTAVVVQDLLSGKILSWRVDKTENADCVRLAFYDVFRGPGIPNSAHLDNGRGFASKWMTGQMAFRHRFKRLDGEPAGILTMLGVKVHWTTPYHGQAKPIERAFGDFCQRIATRPAFSGAWTGANPMDKPENYRSRAVLLETFIKVLSTEIVAHNARIGRRTPVCAGRSFDAVFNESYERAPITKATAEQLRMCMLAAEVVSADRDGAITFLGNRYWSEQAAALAGQRAIARFDPQSLHTSIEVSSLKGVYVGTADCLEAAGFNDTGAAREHGRARNTWMKSQKAMLAAEQRMSALEYASQLPDITPPAAPESKVVRPMRPAAVAGTEARATGRSKKGEFERRLDEETLAMGQVMRLQR